MRRLVFPAIAASVLVAAAPSVAFADDSSPVVTTKAVAPQKVCQIENSKLHDLSGIVATSSGYVTMNDGSEADSKPIYFLDGKCQQAKKGSYGANGPGDPEDMVLQPGKNVVWIADTGDNNVLQNKTSGRSAVALWTLPLSGKTPAEIHRLTYPAEHHDSEAMLISGDGTPIIVTKEFSGPAQLYAPAAALQANTKAGVPMKKAGELTLPATTTHRGSVASVFRNAITGGAISPDGKRVTLRTYADAFEWDVPNGDVLAALKQTPRVTALPDEVQGEAISYTPDGKSYVTVQDMQGGKNEGEDWILKYPISTQVATPAKAAATGGAAGAPKASVSSSLLTKLGFNGVLWLIAGVGIFGLGLLAAGILGIRRHRKAIANDPLPSDDDDDGFGNKVDPETELLGVGGSQRGPVYGNQQQQQRGGPVYGKQQQQQRGTGVYGGAGGGANGSGPNGNGANGNGAGSGGGGGAQRGGPVYGGQRQQPQRQQPQQPQRGPQQQPPRNPQQQPQRGPQQPPGRGGGGGGVYGGGGGSAQQQNYGRPQQPGPRPPQGGGGGRAGVYGQSERGRDGYANNYRGHPDPRFDDYR